MKIVNDTNLPKEIYNLILSGASDYKRGAKTHYSVTNLLNPVQQYILKQRYDAQIVESAEDRLWSLFGSAVHYMIERHSSESSVTEERYYTNIGGKIIAGQIDCYSNHTISDYKVTSVWSIVHGSKISDWTLQLNMYAYLLAVNDVKVDKLQIIAFLRDWSKHKAKQDPKSYPQSSMIIIPLKRMDNCDIKKFMEERIAAFIAAEQLSDEELPPCTVEERWAASDVYALMKQGRKTAVRLFSSQEEAEAAKVDDKHYVVCRPGEPKRCVEYCSVAKFCKQYQKELELKTNGEKTRGDLG